MTGAGCERMGNLSQLAIIHTGVIINQTTSVATKTASSSFTMAQEHTGTTEIVKDNTASYVRRGKKTPSCARGGNTMFYLMELVA